MACTVTLRIKNKIFTLTNIDIQGIVEGDMTPEIFLERLAAMPISGINNVLAEISDLQQQFWDMRTNTSLDRVAVNHDKNVTYDYMRQGLFPNTNPKGILNLMQQVPDTIIDASQRNFLTKILPTLNISIVDKRIKVGDVTADGAMMNVPDMGNHIFLYVPDGTIEGIFKSQHTVEQLIHEALHSLMYDKLRDEDNGELIQQVISEFLKLTDKLPKNTAFYRDVITPILSADVDINQADEIIAYFLSNKQLRDILLPRKGEEPNLFSEIYDDLASFLEEGKGYTETITNETLAAPGDLVNYNGREYVYLRDQGGNAILAHYTVAGIKFDEVSIPKISFKTDPLPIIKNLLVSDGVIVRLDPYNNPLLNEAYLQDTGNTVSLNSSKYEHLRDKFEKMAEEAKKTASLTFTFKTKDFHGRTISIPLPFKLNKEQEEALYRLEEFYNDPNAKRINLVGSAGTGKTTIISIFNKFIEATYGKMPKYSAPTHRALGVTKSMNPSAKVMTLHRLFGLTPKFTEGEYDADKLDFSSQKNPLVSKGDIIIIDEMSMIDDDLNTFITNTINEIGTDNKPKADKEKLNVKVIFLGDKAQLRPVGQSYESKTFNSTNAPGDYGTNTLTKVERTGDNAILFESSRLRIPGTDFVYQTRIKNKIGVRYTENTTELDSIIQREFAHQHKSNNKLHIRILSAKNEQVQTYNKRVRQLLFGPLADKHQFIKGEILMGYSNFGENYRTGDIAVVNGGDYFIHEVSPLKKVSTGHGDWGENFDFWGYEITVTDALSSDPIRITVAANQDFLTSDQKVDQIVAYEAYRNFLQNLRDKGKYNKSFHAIAYNLEKQIAFTEKIVKDGRTLVKKFLDYGYAHTIHKSQGGTYNKVVILADTMTKGYIDEYGNQKGWDDTELQQLKYVAISRASKMSIIHTEVNSLAPPSIEGELDDNYLEEEVTTQKRENLGSLLFKISSEVLPPPEDINFEDFVGNSGGAPGADSAWDLIGRTEGFENFRHFMIDTEVNSTDLIKSVVYEGKKVATNVLPGDRIEGQIRVTTAARIMGRIPYDSTLSKNVEISDPLLIRNWSQVKYSTAVFAIGEIVEKGTVLKDGRIAKVKQVKGGTGYAVQMAISANKPVYVFDQIKGKWFSHSGSNPDKGWAELDYTPTLTQDYAAIGTREINEAGYKAIKAVFQETAKAMMKKSQAKATVASALGLTVEKAEKAQKAEEAPDPIQSPIITPVVDKSQDPTISFHGATEADIVFKPLEFKGEGTGKEYYASRAKKVRENFDKIVKQAEKDFNLTFDLNYGAYTKVDEDYSDLQMAHLIKQNDLVLLPQNLKFDKEAVTWKLDDSNTEYKDKASYRPIIETFIDKTTGEVFVAVPSHDGTRQYEIPAKFVQGFRKYKGEVVRDVQLTEDEIEEAAQVILKAESLMNSKGDGILRTFTKKGTDVSITLPSNKNSVGFTFSNSGAAIDLYNGIQKGDVVRYVRKANPEKGISAVDFRGSVVGIFGNVLQIVDKAGNKSYVQLWNIKEIIYLNENHPELNTIKEDFAEDKEKHIKDYHKKTYFEVLERDGTGFVKDATGRSVTKPVARFDLNVEDAKEKEAALNRRRNALGTLKMGDLVNVLYVVEGKTYSRWRPIIGVTSDVIYFYNGSGTVNHVNIAENAKTRILAVARNNKVDVALMKDFEAKREKYAEYFNLVTQKTGDATFMEERNRAIKEHLQGGKLTSIDEAYYLQGVGQQKEGELVDTAETNIDLKIALSKVQRGDILKAKVFEANGANVFKWFVVVDFAEDGRPNCVTYTKDSDQKTKEGRMFRRAGGYKVYSVNPSDITMIGFNLNEDKKIGVEGHPELQEYLGKVKKKFFQKNAPVLINTKNKAEAFAIAWSKGTRKFKAEAAPFYGMKKNDDGKLVGTWAVSSKWLDEVWTPEKIAEAKIPQQYYIKALNSAKYISQEETNYERRWGLEDKHLKDLDQHIQEGDFIVRTWKYDGKDVYWDYVVEKINDNSIHLIHTDKNGVVQGTILIKDKAKGYGGRGIVEIGIQKKGTNKITGQTRDYATARAIADNIKNFKTDNNVNTTSTSTEVKNHIARRAAKTSPEVITATSSLDKFLQSTDKKVNASKQIMGYKSDGDSLSKITSITKKLKQLYGISAEVLTSEEIAARFEGVIQGNPSTLRGFVYQGKVYINADIASVAEPLHEFSHIILDVLRTQKPELYSQLIGTVRNQADYKTIAKSYPDRTGSDLDEEVFVTMFGEYYRNNLQTTTERDSIFDKIVNFFKEMFVNVFRNPNIMNIDNREFMNMPLSEIFSTFGDDLMQGRFKDILDVAYKNPSRKIEKLKHLLFSRTTEDSDISLTKLCKV